MVNAVGVHWRDHLTEMDELRRSVGLRVRAKDPSASTRTRLSVLSEMMGAMRSGVCSGIFRSSTNLAVFNMLSTLSVAKTTGPESSSEARFDQFRSSPGGGAVPQATEAPEIPTVAARGAGCSEVGRNDPCPCGSGKKYKKCCGAGVAA